jgi:sulfatase maturation enzyme AslB (radical SAM superfamily)
VNVSLYVTHACNLRCSYCFNGHGLQRAMEPRIAEQALPLLFEPDGDQGATLCLAKIRSRAKSATCMQLEID